MTTTAPFYFGTSKQHTGKVILSMLGRETYLVDDVVVVQRYSWRWSGCTHFTAHGHRIEVCIGMGFPPSGEAWVDGELVNGDLFGFERVRTRNRRMDAKVKPGAGGGFVWKMVLWTILLVLFTLLFRHLDSPPPRAGADCRSPGPVGAVKCADR
jgi:hypothetical protein